MRTSETASWMPGCLAWLCLVGVFLATGEVVNSFEKAGRHPFLLLLLGAVTVLAAQWAAGGARGSTRLFFLGLTLVMSGAITLVAVATAGIRIFEFTLFGRTFGLGMAVHTSAALLFALLFVGVVLLAPAVMVGQRIGARRKENILFLEHEGGRAELDQLVRCLGARSPSLRAEALRALGRLGTRPARAAELLSDPDEEVVATAVGALRIMRYRAAAPAVARLLESGTYSTQCAALQYLAELRMRDYLPAIEKLALDLQNAASAAATVALARLGEKEKAAPLVKECLEKETVRGHREDTLLEAIPYLGDPGWLPFLRRELPRAYPSVAGAVMDALAKLGDESDAAAIREFVLKQSSFEPGYGRALLRTRQRGVVLELMKKAAPNDRAALALLLPRFRRGDEGEVMKLLPGSEGLARRRLLLTLGLWGVTEAAGEMEGCLSDPSCAAEAALALGLVGAAASATRIKTTPARASRHDRWAFRVALALLGDEEGRAVAAGLDLEDARELALLALAAGRLQALAAFRRLVETQVELPRTEIPLGELLARVAGAAAISLQADERLGQVTNLPVDTAVFLETPAGAFRILWQTAEDYGNLVWFSLQGDRLELIPPGW